MPVIVRILLAAALPSCAAEVMVHVDGVAPGAGGMGCALFAEAAFAVNQGGTVVWRAELGR